ncbi:MAG: Holliday junction branch migration protein RuvA [Patescibacteria group bacterium]
MIGQIRGKIIHLSLTRATVEVGGLGYVVNSTPSFLEKMHIGNEAKFWTHMAVRENDISLYGFGSEEELKMFESLLSVSGIGPKSALGILGVAGLETLTNAIVTGNTSMLTKIGGVGKKTADKIVLELSGKVASSKNMSEAMKDDLDVFEALKTLGYRENEIKETLKEMPKEITGANDKIKQALKMLGKK